MSERWTDEEVEQLKELVGRNWSSSRIGRELGRTTHAVNMKIHSCGLANRRSGYVRLNYYRLPGPETQQQSRESGS